MIGRMLGAALLRADTYEDVEQDSGATIQALLVVIIFTLANVVGEVLGRGVDADVIRALTVGICQGLASWAVWALFTWKIGTTILKTENTEADWEQLARGTGFAHTPGLLNAFYFVPTVGGFIVLGALVWIFACMVVAVRQSLDYTSTWRAFFVILLAAIPMVALNGILFLDHLSRLKRRIIKRKIRNLKKRGEWD